MRPVHDTLSVSYSFADVRFWKIIFHWPKSLLQFDYSAISTVKTSARFSSQTDLRQYIQSYSATGIQYRIILAQDLNVLICSQKSQLSEITLTIKLLGERLIVCQPPSSRPLTTSRSSRCFFSVNHLLQKDYDTHNK
jgi:hypothetical protein